MITLRNVIFRWQHQAPPVIDIPSLDVAQGERLFIEGPSGSGKSTLLNLLGGVAVPQSGHIQIGETSLTDLSGSARDRFRADHIGFIFQMFNLIPYMSVIDNVTLPCRFSHRRARSVFEKNQTPEAEAERLLTHMEINVKALGCRKAAALSTGQQQRVAVARSLIGAPPLVIADEPTSALDSNARQSFMDLLFKEVARAQSTLLFVSHDQQLRNGFDRSVSLSDINRSHP